MTEIMRFRVQATEIVFLRKVRGLSSLEKVKSTDICQSLNNEPLLLRIEQSLLRWYGHVTRMSHERIAKQLIDAFSSVKGLEGNPKLAGSKIATSCLISGCVEIPARVATPATSK